MPTKLIALATLAAVLIASAALPAQAEGKRTFADRVAGYDTCEKNGGSVRACCLAAGGSYDPGGYPAPSNPKVIIGESCFITADARGAGGKKIFIGHPDVSLTRVN